MIGKEMEMPMDMFYPTFEVYPGTGIIPNIHLPDDYKELVKKFYETGSKKEIEAYKENLEKVILAPLFFS